ncbi:hypothetical protein TNCV_592521 [Trichonephila clavipes]|nr:hypothetical protein TNCV_592521 [Trichonephila clavipes]
MLSTSKESLNIGRIKESEVSKTKNQKETNTALSTMKTVSIRLPHLSFSLYNLSMGGGANSVHPLYLKVVQNYEVAAVAEWYRYRIVASFVASSSPVPLKTRCVGQRLKLNRSIAETSSRWERLWWSPPKDRFLVKEIMTSQRSRSFTWESVKDRTIRRFCSAASQPLTFLYPTLKEVNGAVFMSISGFEVHHTSGYKDQWLNSDPWNVQTQLILRHV